MGLELHMKFTDPRIYRIHILNYNNIICYFRIFTGTWVHTPWIWTCIPCEARITIIFYWSVQIKLALEKPLTNCDIFPDNNDYMAILISYPISIRDTHIIQVVQSARANIGFMGWYGYIVLLIHFFLLLW
jgi:hypothetical protein